MPLVLGGLGSQFTHHMCFVVMQRLEAKVLKKSVNALEVAILPDEIRATLPTMHLSDHMSNCPLLWEGLQEGDNISNLMCFSKTKENIVSCRDVSAAETVSGSRFTHVFVLRRSRVVFLSCSCAKDPHQEANSEMVSGGISGCQGLL